ncbi:hypothetical protein AU577_16900 [Salmonella enterica subsp. enterica serovar Alachua]|nr:hypothetical protein [Salmonella enterica subsp. enterica serovar Alachua]
MGEKFDFDLVATDDASRVIDNVLQSLQSLYAPLAKVQKGLKLGGQDSLNGLTAINGQMKILNQLTKSGVQLIGDMVPPLKMVGSVGLGIGAAATVVKKQIQELREASKNAYDTDVSAKNAGMDVENFTRLTGAMRIIGIDASSAKQSVESLYGVFNDALQGRNNNALSVLQQMGVQIARNKDGTADVVGTMRNLSQVFTSLSGEKQKTVSDVLGLDANDLALLRKGQFNPLMQKSDQFGLTMPDNLNQQMTGLNGTINELGAAWDGLKQKSENAFNSMLVSDGSVKDGLEGITDLLTHGPDNFAIMHVLGATRGSEAEQLRRGYNDPDFYNSLSFSEKMSMDFGLMTDGLRKKFRAYYGATDSAQQLAGDIKSITRPGGYQGVNVTSPANPVNPNARSVRNNNPWNLNYAGQRGASMEEANGTAPRFARFSSPEEGIQAADRQLMLYYTGQSAFAHGRSLDTLDQIITTASPESDGNSTRMMITRASQELGVSSGTHLDLADPAMRAKVLTALFNQEGNNPYSSDQVYSVISGNKNSSPSQGQPPVTDTQQHTQGISDAVRDGLSNTRLQVELTIVDPRNNTRTIATGTTGARIATSMPYTG